MEDGRIPNDHITASSWFSKLLAPYNARLNQEQTDGTNRAGWAARTQRQNQWISVDFAKKVKIHKIATQGLSNLPQYVKTYKIQYSNDGQSFNDYGQILEGNSDNRGTVENRLNPPVEAKVVKIIPLTWNEWIAMRVEFYGCEL